MKPIVTLAVTACLFLAGCGTGAATRPADETPERVADATPVAEADSADRRNEVVCTMDHVVGTRFKQKVCKTRAQIEDEEEGAKDALRRHQETWMGVETARRAGGG